MYRIYFNVSGVIIHVHVHEVLNLHMFLFISSRVIDHVQYRGAEQMLDYGGGGWFLEIEPNEWQ